ncbi:hypothetical protein GGR55DRAFT_589458 [Xylaria sp. FL0064]|nr:hypothetical protein GGR55DRAFT_589458 [Xylaria sp. FL0064]
MQMFPTTWLGNSFRSAGGVVRVATILTGGAVILASASVYEKTEALRCLCIILSRLVRPPQIGLYALVIIGCFATSFRLSRGASRMSRRGLFATPANKKISFLYTNLCAELRQSSWAHGPGLARRNFSRLPPHLCSDEVGMKQCRPPSFSP